MWERRSRSRSKIAVCRFCDIHCQNIESMQPLAIAKLGPVGVGSRVRTMNRFHHWLCRSAHWRKTMHERVPWVVSTADLGPRVLELGPGPGFGTDVLRRSVEHLTALEVDAGLAASLSSRLRGSNVQVIAGDATAMPFPDAQFSGVVSFTMLHHVPSAELQDRLLRQAWRVLEPGGVFVGSDSLQSWLMRVIHIGDTLVPVDPDSFGTRLEAAGFRAVEIGKDSDAFRFYAQRPVAEVSRMGAQNSPPASVRGRYSQSIDTFTTTNLGLGNPISEERNHERKQKESSD